MTTNRSTATGRTVGHNTLTRTGAKRPDTDSVSSITEFSSCPVRWAYHRLDHAPKSTGVDVDRRGVGDITHFVLDFMANGASFDDAFGRALKAVEIPVVPGSQNGVRDLVSQSVQWSPVRPDRPTLLASEVPLSGDIGSVHMVGSADCVEVDPDHKFVIGDYKTGCAPRPLDADLNDPGGTGGLLYPPKATRQGVIYAEMAEQSGVHISRVRMYYLTPRVVIEVNLDDDRGLRLRTEARRFVEYTAEQIDHSIRSGRFRARPSVGKCANCDFQEICEFAATAAPLPSVSQMLVSTSAFTSEGAP